MRLPERHQGDSDGARVVLPLLKGAQPRRRTRARGLQPTRWPVALEFDDVLVADYIHGQQIDAAAGVRRDPPTDNE